MQAPKRIYYISEKIFRFYILKDEIPVLPDFRDELNLYPYWLGITVSGEHIFNSHVITYYPRIYKDIRNDKTKLHKYKIIRSGYYCREDALEKFYEKGGTFTEKELRELKFSHLLDKNFVLNTQQQPKTPAD